jgi:membrane fusion protein (multidrug efflux system)
MTRTKHWKSLAALAALAVLLGCGKGDEAAQSKAPLVVLAPVDPRDLDERIEASGQLLAVDQAEVAAEVQGQVTEVLRDEGEGVEEGDPLLRIDPERRELERADARARLAEARAAERESARDAERIRKLHAQGAVSDARLDQAETASKAAEARRRAMEAQVGVAERAVRDATVRAPFSGLVARRFVSRGEFVRPGERLFELVALDPIEVEFHLPEVDSGRVEPGASVDVRVAPYPDEVFDASVTMISPTIDPSTRTLRVKAVLENPAGRLRPGLFARADLGVARREGVAMVPEEAILQRADGPVVFRLDADDRVQRRVIETGVHREGEVEVVSGLASDDWVVVRGHTQLLDGSRVTPRLADGRPFSRPLARIEAPDEESAP